MSLSLARSPRRALGDKSTNVLLTPSKLHGTEYSSKFSRDAQLLSPPAVAGRKRSIDQVEPEQLAPHSASSSFSNVRREDEFYIPEENTQPSLGSENKENAPLLVEESTEHATVPIHETEPNPSSQQSDGLSSLLNLSFNSDNNPPPRHSTHKPTKSPSIVPTEPAARKAFIQNKASLLRHRLQTAMKSIKETNQIDRRLSDLEALTRERSIDYSQFGNNQSSAVDDATPKATKVPKLLPAADLRPSSRRDTAPLSSPPVSAADEARDHNMLNNNPGTPTHTVPDDEPSTPDFQIHQLSSPPRTGEGPIVSRRNADCSVEKTIAQAKQGQAVDGLLKLMQTTSEYDSLDTWTG